MAKIKEDASTVNTNVDAGAAYIYEAG